MGPTLSFLYFKQNIVIDASLKHLESLPTMNDLESEPTIEELSKAITEMASLKVPSSDDIPVNLFRQCKSCLLPLLHKILVKCWREGNGLQGMRDAKIITFYKNKGTKLCCNNHRGISLLGYADKVFASVILPFPHMFSERVYP